MKKPSKPNQDPEMEAEYDPELFRRGVRGKHAEKYKAGTNLVFLEPDVAKAFPTPDAVNQALRALIRISKTLK